MFVLGYIFENGFLYILGLLGLGALAKESTEKRKGKEALAESERLRKKHGGEDRPLDSP